MTLALNRMANARLVLTDLEAQRRLTLRENTERPVTVTQGTNTVVGSGPQQIVTEALAILDGRNKLGRVPELWDGQAARHIAKVLELW